MIAAPRGPDDRFFADLDMRSSVVRRGLAPHHRSPASAFGPAGQNLRTHLAPETGVRTLQLQPIASPFWSPVPVHFWRAKRALIP